MLASNPTLTTACCNSFSEFHPFFTESHLILVFVCAYRGLLVRACPGARVTSEDHWWVSVLLVYHVVPGIEPSSSGLAASPSTHWAISPSFHSFCFWIWWEILCSLRWWTWRDHFGWFLTVPSGSFWLYLLPDYFLPFNVYFCQSWFFS